MCKTFTWKITKLLREIKDLNEWRAMSCSWIKRLNIVNMSILPNWSIDLGICFIKIGKLTLNFTWENKVSGIAKIILKNNNKFGRLTLLISACTIKLQQPGTVHTSIRINI